MHLRGPTSNGRGRERERQGREVKEREEGKRGNGREETASHIHPPPWASQNLGPALCSLNAVF